MLTEEEELLDLLENIFGGETLDQFINRVSPHLPPPEHLKPLRDLIERTRHEEVRALISYPPRHGKSVTINHGLAWRIMRDPTALNVYVTYGDDLAKTQSRYARDLALEGGVSLAQDSKSVTDWRTKQGGGLFSTSIGGALTGIGVKDGGILVIDDFYKDRINADSSLQREKVVEWFQSVAYPRLEKGASVIINSTRWHPDDLIGFLSKNPGWEVINMPACHDGDLNPVDPTHPNAQALWEQEFNLSKLLDYYREAGEFVFNGLYQGHPRHKGNTLFKEPARFNLSDFSPAGKKTIIAVDPAASAKSKSDYSAITTMAVDNDYYYITGFEKHQVEIPELVNKLIYLQSNSKYGKGAPIAVEAVGGFKAVPQMLRAVNKLLNITEIYPRGDKFTRSQPLAAAWNDGKVLVPNDVEWAPEFINDMCSFTGVNDFHDDTLDSCVMAFDYYKQKKTYKVKRGIFI